VLDSTKVERGLYLALELIEEGRLVVIALNMRDVARDKRIQIDTVEMERILGVPVVPTIATGGEGIKELVSRVEDASKVEVEAISERAAGGVE
jgi:ferrous iron transport protein B